MEKQLRYERIIKITEEELSAVEDIFFSEVPEEEHKRIWPLLVNVWEQLCPSVEETEKARAKFTQTRTNHTERR